MKNPKAPGLKMPLKTLVGLTTTFVENGNFCKVTRVTDFDFDTLDTVTGAVTVRSLHEWQTPRFTNGISCVRGLLKLSGAATQEDIVRYMSR
jgi:hypothetical protein